MKEKVYSAIEDTLSDLTEREQEIVSRRFGLGREKQTLQAIGDVYSLTRERVRQIQDKALNNIMPKLKKHSFIEELFKGAKNALGKIKIKKEKIFMNSLGDIYNLSGNDLNSLRFFLILDKKLGHYPEDDSVHEFWGDSEKRIVLANNILKKIMLILSKKPDKLWKSKEILELINNEIARHFGVRGKTEELKDFLGILKTIGKNPNDEFGILTHPHISPSSLDDKILFVMQNKGEPMHFSEIYDDLAKLSEFEDEFLSDRWKKDYSKQSIQNLLIMNPKFVWTGRGTYALKDWGFCEGTISDRMREIVKKHKEISAKKLFDILTKERKFSKITFEAYLRDRSNFSTANGFVKLAK